MLDSKLPDNWRIRETYSDAITLYYDIDTRVELRENGCLVLRNDSDEIHICDIDGFTKDVATIRKLYFTE